jgi:ABC-type antimicrobial peptide transport system permease subunit
MDRIDSADLRFSGFWFRLLVITSALALLLSMVGIYSVMAFTVARRTREIGIRLALGCDARHIVASIFRRPLFQVGLGVVAGAGLVAFLGFRAAGGGLGPGGTALVAAYATLMLIVCMFACVVPTRRALRIEPTEAIRTDG